MASYSGAMERIAYLLRLSADERATPATLNGDKNAVYSYGLCIVRKTNDGYIVHERNSTATTNRHISAACMVLMDRGYERTGTDEYGWSHFVKREGA